MPERPLNFSAGPAILPTEVFERCGQALQQLGRDDALESQLSILEISHRSKSYDGVHQNAMALCHDVLGVPKTHEVLFLQGGASMQFCMVPMNLRMAGKPAAYIDTGAWSKKAIVESRLLGPTEVVATSADTGYDRIPAVPDASTYRDASYVHITSNNTIYGTEYAELPALEGGTALVVDMSSNIGSRPMKLERVAVGFAGAQKNLGPSGLAMVFIHRDLLDRQGPGPVPTMLRYKTHAEKNSLFNTPNTFGVLVLEQVLLWIQRNGGVEALGKINERKAAKLYDVLDNSSLYNAHAQPGSRSTMNVTWTLSADTGEAREVRTKRFIAEAAEAGMSGLKGHRSVGGIRASIYNAFPESGVDTLCEFMREFERRGV